MKTIKDIMVCSIERESKFYHLIDPQDLKQSVIEDIKELQGKIKKTENHKRSGYCGTSDCDNCVDIDKWLNQIEYIKKKFNI